MAAAWAGVAWWASGAMASRRIWRGVRDCSQSSQGGVVLMQSRAEQSCGWREGQEEGEGQAVNLAGLQGLQQCAGGGLNSIQFSGAPWVFCASNSVASCKLLEGGGVSCQATARQRCPWPHHQRAAKRLSLGMQAPDSPQTTPALHDSSRPVITHWHVGQVQLPLHPVNHCVDRSGRHKLQVGLHVIKLHPPVVDLQAGQAQRQQPKSDSTSSNAPC